MTAKQQTGHLKWAASVARQIAEALPPAFPREDLEQEAMIGCVRAMRRYQPSRGVPFRAFASPYVKGAVYMSVRRKAWKEAMHTGLPASAPVEEDLHAEVEKRVITEQVWRVARAILTPRQFRLLWVRYHDEVPVNEAIRMLRMSRSTFFQLHRDAIRRLSAWGRNIQ